MADLDGDINKLNDQEIGDDKPLSEALIQKLGANVNGLIDRKWRVDEFTASGTWTAPSNNSISFVYLIGCGGGQGGGGSSNASNNNLEGRNFPLGSNGGDTSFDSAVFKGGTQSILDITYDVGSVGEPAYIGGASVRGGSVGGTLAGVDGDSNNGYNGGSGNIGGGGGAGPFGSGGNGGASASNGSSASANTGAGGGGGGATAGADDQVSGVGGAGAPLGARVFSVTPGTSYTITIGSGGSGASGSTGNGGNGGSGKLYVIYYDESA